MIFRRVTGAQLRKLALYQKNLLIFAARYDTLNLYLRIRRILRHGAPVCRFGRV